MVQSCSCHVASRGRLGTTIMPGRQRSDDYLDVGANQAHQVSSRVGLRGLPLMTPKIESHRSSDVPFEVQRRSADFVGDLQEWDGDRRSRRSPGLPTSLWFYYADGHGQPVGTQAIWKPPGSFQGSGGHALAPLPRADSDQAPPGEPGGLSFPPSQLATREIENDFHQNPGYRRAPTSA
jgi:hypothetical protein